MDCSPPGSSVHWILQARILECVVIPFSRGSSWPRDRTQVSCIAGGVFTFWATREAPNGWEGLISSVQSLGCVELFATLETAAWQASLSITTSQSLLKLMSTELVMPSNHLILCCPLLLLPSVFPSIRVFSNESTLGIRWPKYWSFSFSISPSNEYLELISFRMDWPDQTIKWPDHWPDLITQIKWTEKGWRIRVKAEVTELNPKLKVDHISTMWDGDPWPSPVQLHEFYICSCVDMWVDYGCCVVLDSTANIWPESLSVLFLELLTSTKFREKAISTSQSTFSMFLFHHRLVAKSCLTLATPMDYNLARLLCPWGFSRPEYWIGLPYPSPGDRPYPGIEPGSPARQADSLPTGLQGKPRLNRTCLVMIKMWLQCNI